MTPLLGTDVNVSFATTVTVNMSVDPPAVTVTLYVPGADGAVPTIEVPETESQDTPETERSLPDVTFEMLIDWPAYTVMSSTLSGTE